MSQLVITTIGHDRPGIVSELTELVSAAGGNIEDTRAATMGQEFAVLMRIELDGDTQAFTDQLNAFATQQGMEVLVRETSDQAAPSGALFQVTISAMDHPGIVHGVTSYLAERGFNVTDLQTSVSRAAHTGSPVFELSMQVATNDTSTAWHAAFADHCAELGLEAAIEAS